MVKNPLLNRIKVQSRRPIDIVKQLNYEKGDVCLVTCSDLHLMNDWSYGKYNTIGINNDLEEKKNAFEEAACVALAIKAPFIFCGDLLDQRNVDGVTSWFAAEALASLKYKTGVKGIPDYIILGGNHEYDDTAAFFSTIKQYQHFLGSMAGDKRGYITTDIENIEVKTKDKVINFHCFPANQNIEQQLKDSYKSIAKQIKKNNEASYNIMLLHGGIEGADIGQLKFKGGINFDIIEQYSKIFDWIICGDFHKFQFVNGLKNVYYCGSMKQMNLGDTGQSRGYQVLNLTKGIVNFIPSKCLTFKKLEMVANEYMHPWIKNPQKYADKIKNKIFDIKITGLSEDIEKIDFDKIKEEMIKFGAFGVYKTPNPIVEKRNSMKIDKNNSKIDIITKYVENKFYDQKKIKIKKYIKELEKYAKE